jgi:hypothetical protein
MPTRYRTKRWTASNRFIAVIKAKQKSQNLMVRRSPQYAEGRGAGAAFGDGTGGETGVDGAFPEVAWGSTACVDIGAILISKGPTDPHERLREKQ